MSSTVCPKGSTILVTGVTGFIASHVVNEALKAGYRVRGTVRDEAKSKWVAEYFHEHYGKDKFETFVVPNYAAPHAFKQAMKGCSGIAHVAGDVSFGTDPHDVVLPAIKAMQELLEDAEQETSIVRVVITSSSTATWSVAPNTKMHVDANTWNDAAVEQAWAKPPYTQDRGYPVYAASKVEGERAAWRYVKEYKPHFVFNSVLPSCTMGEILNPKQSGSTGGWIKDMFLGKPEGAATIELVSPQYGVNVIDIALLHLGALILPDVQNQRLLGFAFSHTFNDIVTELGKIDGPNKNVVAKIEDNSRDLSTVDTAATEEVLKKLGRPGFAGFAESLKQIIHGS